MCISGSEDDDLSTSDPQKIKFSLSVRNLDLAFDSVTLVFTLVA